MTYELKDDAKNNKFGKARYKKDWFEALYDDKGFLKCIMLLIISCIA